MPKSLREYVAEALETVKEIEPERVSRLAGWIILDVREADEFSEGHVPGAWNSPRGFLEVKADMEHHKRDPRLADRSMPIVCYCGGGNRSALAAKTLQEMGFVSVLSMRGGWKAYQELGLPVEL